MKKGMFWAVAILGLVGLAYFLTAESPDKIDTNQTITTDLSNQQANQQAAKQPVDGTQFPVGELVETVPAGLMFGNYHSENLEDLFFAHLDAALAGNAESQHEVHSVLEQCDVAGAMIGLSGGRQNLQTDSQDDLTIELKRVAEQCATISAGVPRFKTPDEWSEELLSNAAENGSKVAKLKVEWPAGDTSEETYQVIAANLEDAVREGHYASYYYASDFLAGFHHSDGMDVNLIEMLKWQAIGCEKQNTCNLSAFYHNLENELTPTEVAIIKDFVSGFNERLEDPSPFGFADGWLPLYEYTATTDRRSGIVNSG